MELASARRVAVVIAGSIALFAGVAGPADAGHAPAPRKPSHVAANAPKHKPVPTACTLVKNAKDLTCVGTAVESWYNTESSAVPAPTSVPAPPTPLPAGPPPVNPYAAKTLHVGIKLGQEDSRTYITLDTGGLGIGALPTGGSLVVAVDPADSSGVKSAHLQACYAPEPPKKSEEGSVDAPPKPDCSIQSDAKYVKKPRPHVTFDLGPFASILTSGGGIALMPTDKAANDQENWHLETYAKKNRAKHAIAIGALLKIKKVSVPPLSGITGPGGSAGISASGGGSSASGGVGGLSIGTNTGSQPGTSFAGQGGGLSAPVNTGTQTSAAPVALAPVVAVRYPGVWFLPLALLIGASFFGFALTKDVIVRRS